MAIAYLQLIPNSPQIITGNSAVVKQTTEPIADSESAGVCFVCLPRASAHQRGSISDDPLSLPAPRVPSGGPPARYGKYTGCVGLCTLASRGPWLGLHANRDEEHGPQGRLVPRASASSSLRRRPLPGRCRSVAENVLRLVLVVSRDVCYQTQLITAGSPCRSISC